MIKSEKKSELSHRTPLPSGLPSSTRRQLASRWAHPLLLRKGFGSDGLKGSGNTAGFVGIQIQTEECEMKFGINALSAPILAMIWLMTTT